MYLTAFMLTSTCVIFMGIQSSFVFGSPKKGGASPGTLHFRSYFYVGGRYTPTVDGGSVIQAGQMYVEHLVPQTVSKPFPIVMIHGNGMTGTNFLNTPDGSPGWADYFLSQGHEVYIVDQPSRGRSAWQKNIDGQQSVFDVLTIEQRFTATRESNLWPQARLHTQWPGNGSRGDEIFDNFFASIMPSLTSVIEASQDMKTAGIVLLEKIGPAIVITHSQSGQFGWLLADARPSLVKAIVAIEPTGPPFISAVFPPIGPARPYGLTEIPVEFSPPIESSADLSTTIVSSTPAFSCIQQVAPSRKLTNIAKVSVLVVTSESGYHSLYDTCSVDFLRNAGVSVKHVELQDAGIFGNGHMMFMEKNGLQIADNVVKRWLDEVV